MFGSVQKTVFGVTISPRTHGTLTRKKKDWWKTISAGSLLSPDAVWVSTEESGVSIYSTINQTFTESHTRTDRIESDFIRAIAVDGDNVCLGSADRGIRRYITTVDTWFKYTTAQGLGSVITLLCWLSMGGTFAWYLRARFGPI